MHEMSIAESVLGIVEDTARREGFSRVKEVRLEIGQLAAVETQALRFCFDAVVRGSVAEGARLAIDEAPGTAWCFDCSATVPLQARGEPVPACGGAQLQVNGGTEMRVKDLLGADGAGTLERNVQSNRLRTRRRTCARPADAERMR